MQAKRKRGRTPTPGRYQGLRDNKRGTFWNNSCICLRRHLLFCSEILCEPSLHTSLYILRKTWLIRSLTIILDLQQSSLPFCMNLQLVPCCALLSRPKHLHYQTIWRPICESRACKVGY